MQETDPSKPPEAAPPPLQPSPPLSEGERRTVRYAVIGLVLLGLAAFVPMVAFFFSPLVLAATFAAILHPVYKWLFRHLGRNGPLAALLTSLLLIVGVLTPIYILIHLVIIQLLELYETAAPTVQQIIQEGTSNQWVQRVLAHPIGAWLVENVRWQSVLADLQKSAAALGTFILNRTYAGIYGLVATLLISLFIFFYFLFDGERILSAIRQLVPLYGRYKVRLTLGFLNISRAMVKGLFVIGLIQGALGALTLLIFGIETWLLWGFVTIVFSIIPFLSGHVVLIPAGIIQIMLGNLWQGIGIIVVDLVLIGSVDNLLRPRLLGAGAKMHDLIVFIATLGGLSIFGVMGVIIGPVLASFFLTSLQVYKEEFGEQLDRMQKS